MNKSVKFNTNQYKLRSWLRDYDPKARALTDDELDQVLLKARSLYLDD